MCVCVLCMGVTEIISACIASAGTGCYLYWITPEKFLRVSLPISLTCKAERMMKVRRKGIMVERKERRKKGYRISE